MSDYDDRRTDSHPHTDNEDEEFYGHNNDFSALLGIETERGRPQFHISNIPNELGDEELASFDVQNDVMVFVGTNGKVIIRDTKVDQKPISTNVPSAYKGFVSPDGQHVFISTHDGNLYYFSLHNRKANTYQKVNKDTGAKQAMVVETVCWDVEATGKAVTTGTVLLGSKSGGLIFAASVEVTATPLSATFVFCRHLLHLPDADNGPVHGLQVIHNKSIHSTTVLATTTTRMYPFVGKDRIAKGRGGATRYVPLGPEEVLSMYKNGKQCEILDMGLKSAVTKGTLAVMRPRPDEPLSFAWLSTSGITHGLFNKKGLLDGDGGSATNKAKQAIGSGGDDDSNNSDDDDNNNAGEAEESEEVADQFANQCHIPIGQRGVGSMGMAVLSNNTANGSANSAMTAGGGGGHRMPTIPPIDLVISAFHMFILYENRIIVLGHPAGLSWRPNSSLSNNGNDIGGGHSSGAELTEVEVNARIRFDPYEHRNTRPFIGIVRDEATRKVFYYNKFTAFELTVENEHIGQWKLFLAQAIDKETDKNLRLRAFEAALKLSFGSVQRRDLVTYAYGKYLIELRAYARGTSMLARCGRFEDIFMYLRDLKRPAVLLDYLVKRYKFLLTFRDNRRGGSQIPSSKNGGEDLKLLAQKLSGAADDADNEEGKQGKKKPAYIGAMESQLISLLCVIIQMKLEAINRIESDSGHDKKVVSEMLSQLREFTMTAVDAHRAAIEKPAISETIGRLFTAHGRVDLMLAFSEKLGHVRYAIHFFISRGRYAEACKLLIDRCSIRGHEEVWYAFAPRLIQHVPIQLINGMNNFKIPRSHASYGNNAFDQDDNLSATVGGGAMVRALDPARLIPAFVHYRPEMNELQNGRRPEGHKVIPYLRNCIRQDKNMDPLVHNFYVSILAEFDVEILRSFLQQDDHVDYVGGNYYYYGRGGGGGSSNQHAVERSTAYDPEYALRQCIRFHRHQYCVPLYKRLGLYEDAIAIALESSRPHHDDKDAKDDGDNKEDSPSFSWEGLAIVTDEILDRRPEWMEPAVFKGLWLSVAQRVVREVGTRDTLTVVESSRGVLKLEDILPFIGDSTVIQDFKEAIVNSLNEYTDSINAVKQKEEEAKRVSADIKREIDTLQSRFGYVSSRQQCMLCHQNVFGSGGGGAGSSSSPSPSGYASAAERPFLVFPSCKHLFHEDCAKAKMASIGAFSLLKSESDELPAGYLDGVVCDEDVATLECIYCGELAIVEITAPVIEEEPSSWDVPEFKRK